MNELIKKINEANTIAIAGHLTPDGDATGACLALNAYIRKNFPDKQTHVFLKFPSDKFSFLYGYADIEDAGESTLVPDLMIALDCADKDRLGIGMTVYDRALDTICIDHHETNLGFAKTNIIDGSSSSTCEVLYGLLDDALIDREVAECLYMGIIHDTGVFKYSCTSPQTMRVAANLMEKGVDTCGIIDDTFYARTYLQAQILGRQLMESTVMMDGRVIFAVLPLKIKQLYGVNDQDIDGIAEQLRLTKGIECAIFIHEKTPHEFKVSMRSKEIVDVSTVATKFGGGGHKRAAGCTIFGNAYDVINNIALSIEKQLV